jgi:predicted ATP-grasp superfamily ATP-dependent carboligase
MNGLMVAFAFILPYHLLRTATAAGVRVHVLGSGPSRALRNSRYCASYRTSAQRWDGPAEHEALLAEIREVVQRRHIDVIFPSDDVSTRLLAALHDRLPVRTTPLPDVATFDLLNDKWNFTRFALAHGVRVPQGWLRSSADAVRRDLAGGVLRLPLTAKPVNRSGGYGVVHLRDEADLAQLDRIDYRPILLQRHIVGETIGISVVARAGRVLVHATQRRDERRFELFADPDLADDVARLVAACGFSGPANFDAVLEEASGLSWIVECNPRFWYTIWMAMVAGLNFLDYAFAAEPPAAVPPATLAGAAIQLSPRDVVRHPRRATSRDWQMLRHHLRDPLPYVLARTHMVDDRDVAVEALDTRDDATPADRLSQALVA